MIKKMISLLLLSLLFISIIGSPVSQPIQSSVLSEFEMVMVEGGLRWACWAAIGGMAFATAGMAAGAASIVGFGIGFGGLICATAALVDGCG